MAKNKKPEKKLTKDAIEKKLLKVFPELKVNKDSKKIKTHLKAASKELSACFKLVRKKSADMETKSAKTKLIIDGAVSRLP